MKLQTFFLCVSTPFLLSSFSDLFFSKAANAQLDICNGYHDEIWVAIAYNKRDYSNFLARQNRPRRSRGRRSNPKVGGNGPWMSSGWYHLEVGECGRPLSTLEPLNNFWYYANSSNRTRASWGGNWQWCTDSRQAFDFHVNEAGSGCPSFSESLIHELNLRPRVEGFRIKDVSDRDYYRLNLVD